MHKVQQVLRFHGACRPFFRRSVYIRRITDQATHTDFEIFGDRLKIFRSVDSFVVYRNSLFLSEPTKTVGFVPTMGALHVGHKSLYDCARTENDILIGSIFVNPTQFGPNEDLDRYPRTPMADCELLAAAGVDAVFMPTPADMYGPHHRTWVVPGGFDHLPEAADRPGHFRGVATVVAQLLNLARPHRSYFGQKDALQCAVLRRVAADLRLPGEIVVRPTVREADGLALSSRNAYLTGPGEREAATVLYKALLAMQEKRESSGTPVVKSAELKHVGMKILKAEPLISSIQYLSIGSKETMEEIEEVGEDGAVVSLAVKLGSVRLIDNIVL